MTPHTDRKQTVQLRTILFGRDSTGSIKTRKDIDLDDDQWDKAEREV
jgi:hypothetical protein